MWSEQARAASARARSHRAAKPTRKATPISWYHGGPTALRGNRIKRSHQIDVSGGKERVRVSFATASLKQAIVYAGQAKFGKPGAVYKVSPGASKRYMHRDPIGKHVLNLGVGGRAIVTKRLPVQYGEKSKAFNKSSRVVSHKRVRGI